MATHYDKFSYSSRRNRCEKDGAGEVSAYGQRRPPVANLDPDASVLNPLRHGAYNFAIAEDGVLHSRVVAPPRVAYAPVIAELDAPLMPRSAMERLRRLLRIQQDVSIAAFDWRDVDGALCALEQQDVERERARDDALAAARRQQQAEEGELFDEAAFRRNYDAAAKEMSAESEEEYAERERVTALDRAKIELIWKRGRMLFGASTASFAVHSMNQKQQQELDTSAAAAASAAARQPSTASSRRAKSPSGSRAGSRASTSRHGSPSASSATSGGGGGGGAGAVPNAIAAAQAELEQIRMRQQQQQQQQPQRDESPAISHGGFDDSGAVEQPRFRSQQRASSATPSSSAHNVMGRRTIFNEKLRWSNKPRVDSNNFVR